MRASTFFRPASGFRSTCGTPARRMPCIRTSTSSRAMVPQYPVILAGDHIYKMDYEPMLQQHVEQGADVTVGCLEVPRAQATGFGVMGVDDADRIVTFVEKPKAPPGIPDRPE